VNSYVVITIKYLNSSLIDGYMSLKVRNYQILQHDQKESDFQLEGLPFSVKAVSRIPSSISLQLYGGRTFSMHHIPEHVAEGLTQTVDDATGDFSYVLRAISKNNSGPFPPMDRVNIKLDYVDEGCLLSGNELVWGRTLEVVSCDCAKFRDNSEAYMMLRDGTKIGLKNTTHAIYIASIFGCDVYVNDQKVDGLFYQMIPCNGGQYMTITEMDGSLDVMGFIGAPNHEALFLGSYDYRSKTHAIDRTPPAEDFRYSMDAYVHRAFRDGLELEKVEINSINEVGVYSAEALTNQGPVRMVPSNAFLLAECLKADTFVAEDLVEEQENLRSQMGDQ
jgi:hypothetical protein